MTVLLDITRSLSRVGLGAKTGVDRVETAYIHEVLERFESPKFVAKMGRYYTLVSADTVRKFLDFDQQRNWPRPKGIDNLRLKLLREQRSARSFLRCNAEAYVRQESLHAACKTSLEANFEYINVGHTNLSEEFFDQLRIGGCRQIAVFVHDLIPLDHPEFTRPDTLIRFQKSMKSVAKHADRIICNSLYTRSRIEKWFPEFGAQPKTIVAPLGVEVPAVQAKNPSLNDTNYFLCIGTIEPRKNHMVLLDTWEKLAETIPKSDMPHLKIIGRRGWENHDVFKKLDESHLIGKSLFELSGVPDDTMWDMLKNARALVFPSHVEGFGLPVAEAALLNVPVICSDLPVMREVLEDYADYLPADSVVAWTEKVIEFNARPIQDDPPRALATTVRENLKWSSHFSHVFEV